MFPNTENNIHQFIQSEIEQNDVVLFLKGTPDNPLCGFSGVVVKLLNKLGIEFKGIDVLTDSALREGIKTFTNWPTIPQLYVKQEFIGGADIVREMHANNELIPMFEAKGIKITQN